MSDKSSSWKQLMTVAWPLILSNLSIALMSFADRVFLGKLSAKALAASLPAAAMSFGFCALFLGTSSYVGTFVSQYYGANLKRKIGPMLWQGVYFSAITLPIIPLAFFFSHHLFAPFQADLEILEYELIYFNRMFTGVLPLTLSFCLSSFYSGQGRTWPVFWVNTVSTLANLILDYVFIFGKWGFPAWGIAGAAWATVIAQWLGVVFYVLLIFLEQKKQNFGFEHFQFHKKEFLRLLKYGLPAGVHFFVDVISFTLFMLLLSNLGEIALAATNIALQVHFLAFLPLTGIGLALSILVGQYMGERKADLAVRVLVDSQKLVLPPLIVLAASFVFFPEFYLYFFSKDVSDGNILKVLEAAKVLLRFCAAFLLFDALQVLYSSHLKGAGDTAFVMRSLLVCGGLFLVAPAWYMSLQGNYSLYSFWYLLSIYILILAMVFGIRVLKGKWKRLDLIGDQEKILS